MLITHVQTLCTPLHLSHPSHCSCSLFFSFFFFFFSSNHARGPTTQYYTLLHCPITTCDMSFSFLIAVGFYIYSSTLLPLEQRSRIMKHAWRVCLPWLMDQTKTNTVFQKALHAVSKLWSRRSSHSPSQLFSTPFIYVAWLFILPLSGPFVCLVCIQKIHPCHPLPTLWHKKKKKKKRGAAERRGSWRESWKEKKIVLHCSVNADFSKLSWEGNWIVSHGGERNQVRQNYTHVVRTFR